MVASISKPTPFIYLAFEKKKKKKKKKKHPFIYSIVRNVYLFIYCPMIWQLDKKGSQFIEYQENKQPRKISERKIYAYFPVCQKSGAFHIQIKKSRVSHIYFLLKKRGLIIPGSTEKGGHSARTSVLCHI